MVLNQLNIDGYRIDFIALVVCLVLSVVCVEVNKENHWGSKRMENGLKR